MQVIPLHVTKSIVEILCDYRAYAYTTNVFDNYTHFGDTEMKLTLESRYIEAVRKNISIISNREIADLSPLPADGHFLFDIIAYIGKMTNLPDYSPENLGQLVKYLLKRYPEFEVEYLQGKTLIEMQAHTPNTQHTLITTLIKNKKITPPVDAETINVAVRGLLEYFRSASDYQASDDAEHSVSKYVGSRIKDFCQYSYNYGVKKMTIDKITDEGNSDRDSNLVLSMELFGNAQQKEVVDVDIEKLKVYANMCDSTILHRFNRESIGIVLHFLEKEAIEKLGLESSITYDDANTRNVWKQYKSLIDYTERYITNLKSIDDIAPFYNNWITFYNQTRMGDENTKVDKIAPLLINTNPSILAFSAMMLCICEVRKLSGYLNSLGFNLMDAELHPIENVGNATTLYQHLNNAHGKRKSFMLEDPDLKTFFNLPTNDAVNEMLKKVYLHDVKEVFTVNLKDYDKIRLSTMYGKIFSDREDVPEDNDASKSNEAKVVPQPPLAEKILIGQMQRLCVSPNITTEYYRFKKSQAKTTIAYPALTKALSNPSIGNIEQFEAIIANTYTKLAKKVGMPLPEKAESLHNKLMYIQNYYFVSNTSTEDLEKYINADPLTALSKVLQVRIRTNNAYQQMSYDSRTMTIDEMCRIDNAITNAVPNRLEYAKHCNALAIMESKVKAATKEILVGKQYAEGMSLILTEYRNNLKEIRKSIFNANQTEYDITDPRLFSNLISVDKFGNRLGTNDLGLITVDGLPYYKPLANNIGIYFITKEGAPVPCSLSYEKTIKLAKVQSTLFSV